MAGYVTIANEASNLARTPGERAFVMYLYAEGDRMRWKPFRASDRWLRDMSGMGSRQCRSFLATLVSMDLVEITSKGDNYNPRMVLVKCPKKAERKPPHNQTHKETHEKAPTSKRVRKAGALPDALPDAQGGAKIPPSTSNSTPTPDHYSGTSPTRLATDTWTAVHQTLFGQDYPWLFKGRNHDGSKIKVWLAAVKLDRKTLTDAETSAGIAALRSGITAYMSAVKAGTAWPADEPATTARFTDNIAKWLRTDPAKVATTETDTDRAIREMREQTRTEAENGYR